MKHIILSAVVSLGALSTPIHAQDTAPVPTFAEEVSGLKTNDLQGLLKVNPATRVVIEELRKRADAGDVTAMIRLGEALRTGNGVDKNVEAGLTYLQMAAQTESAWGLATFGNALYVYAGDNEQQKRTALGALQASFAQGNVGAAVSISKKTPTDWATYVQQQFVARGYYLGAPDGVAGPLTQNALRLFCEDRKLEVDCSQGIFDTPVVRAVFKKFVAGE